VAPSQVQQRRESQALRLAPDQGLPLPPGQELRVVPNRELLLELNPGRLPLPNRAVRLALRQEQPLEARAEQPPTPKLAEQRERGQAQRQAAKRGEPQRAKVRRVLLAVRLRLPRKETPTTLMPAVKR
jgi:hypothetical protein